MKNHLNAVTLWAGMYSISTGLFFFETHSILIALKMGLAGATLKTVWSKVHHWLVSAHPVAHKAKVRLIELFRNRALVVSTAATLILATLFLIAAIDDDSPGSKRPWAILPRDDEWIEAVEF